MGSAFPGLKVGPLDPDATEAFGQVSAKNSSRKLIRLHTQAHPPALRQALSRKRDDERTKGLDGEEVADYVAGLELDNGDPVLPEGAVVSGAAVRGDRDREQILAFTYRTRSGREAKWFAPYNSDVLPDSYEAGTEFVRVKEQRERGVVAFDESGHEVARLRAQQSRDRRTIDALRQSAEARGGDVGPVGEGDELPSVEADASIVERNEELARANVELKQRVSQLEQLVERLPGEVLQSAPAAAAVHDVAAEGEPVDGYDDLKANEVIKLVKDDDTSDETRERIRDYELKHQNRRTVVGAAEESLGARG